MKKILFSLTLVVFALTAGNLFAADPIVGTYKTIDDSTKKKKSIVEIYEQNGKIYAKITKLFGDKVTSKCDKCSGSRKDKPVVGMVFVWNMKNKGDVYKGGKILDPKNGKTYTCKMWLNGNKLKVRGYIAFFYRTQYWYKIK